MIQRVTGWLERVSVTGPAPSTALWASLKMQSVAITLTVTTLAGATPTYGRITPKLSSNHFSLDILIESERSKYIMYIYY